MTEKEKREKLRESICQESDKDVLDLEKVIANKTEQFNTEIKVLTDSLDVLKLRREAYKLLK